MPAKPSRSFFRRCLRFFAWSALVLISLVALLLIPKVFQAAVKNGLQFEMWRRGGKVEIGRVEGSLFSPLLLIDARWTYHRKGGALTRLEIAKTHAEFSWHSLLPARGGRWFQRLAVEGVVGKMEIPPVPPSRPGSEGDSQRDFPLGWFPGPARVDGKNVDLLFLCGPDYVRLQESQWRFSEVEPGSIEISQLVLKQPWMARTFRGVRGATAIKDGVLFLANLRLDPLVAVERFSAPLRQVVSGSPKLSLKIVAFGGEIDAEAASGTDQGDPEFDATVQFANIKIAQLASFLGLSDAAGGLIQTGRLTFRGVPHEPFKAIADLRFEATNFQWDSRQWDSLVLGAKLVNGRVQIPELVLRQGHNYLSLNGESAFPMLARAGVPWWQSDFTCKLVAQIDNLPELSALLLPEFQYASGKIGIDGSISAKDRQFSGHLIVTGSDLSWRSTSIQELRGAVRLSGQEIQIASLDLLNKDDYLHGQGTINVGPAYEYRGDFRASIQDFAEYAALLENPAFPTPLAGGAVLRWSGNGKGPAHQGRFYAKLQKLRLPWPDASRPHPVNADFEGSYDGGQTQFTRFALADEECDVSAQVKLTGAALEVRELRLKHGGQLWLQGDALLPLDFWQSWTHPAPAPPKGPGSPLKLNLKASGLSLKHAARLSGWDWPVEGFVDGELTGEGALGELRLSGSGTLRSGLIPLGWSGESLEAAQGDFQAAGQILTVTNGSAEHRTGKYTGRAQLDLARYWDPQLSAEVQCEHASFPIFQDIQPLVLNAEGALAPLPMRAEASMSLRVAGPFSAALVEGEVHLKKLSLGGAPAISFLWNRASKLVELPAPFSVTIAPIAGWPLQLSATQKDPAAISPGEGTILPQAQIRGTAGQPHLFGTVRLSNLPAQGGSLPLVIKECTLNFSEGRPGDPMMDLHATGVIEHFPFNAYILGPLSNHMAFADSDKVLALFTPGGELLQGDTTPLQLMVPVPGSGKSPPQLPWPASIR